MNFKKRHSTTSEGKSPDLFLLATLCRQTSREDEDDHTLSDRLSFKTFGEFYLVLHIKVVVSRIKTSLRAKLESGPVAVGSDSGIASLKN